MELVAYAFYVVFDSLGYVLIYAQDALASSYVVLLSARDCHNVVVVLTSLYH